MKMKIMTVFLAVMFACISAADVKKSNLAGKSIVIDDAPTVMPTAIDYVQEGLVAHWDAIENVGYGMHDSSSAVWVDLTGRFPFMINVGACEWTEYSLENNTSSAIQSFGSIRSNLNWFYEAGLIDGIEEDGRTAYLTHSYVLEIVCSINTPTPNNAMIGFVFYGASGAPSFTTWYSWNSPRVMFGPSRSPGNLYEGYIIVDKIGEMISYSGLRNTELDIANLYANGNFVNSYFGKGNDYIDIRYSFGIYFNPYCSFSSIRLYNRALTDKERMYNYRIDKLRFGVR